MKISNSNKNCFSTSQQIFPSTMNENKNSNRKIDITRPQLHLKKKRWKKLLIKHEFTSSSKSSCSWPSLQVDLNFLNDFKGTEIFFSRYFTRSRAQIFQLPLLRAMLQWAMEMSMIAIIDRAESFEIGCVTLPAVFPFTFHSRAEERRETNMLLRFILTLICIVTSKRATLHLLISFQQIA